MSTIAIVGVGVTILVAVGGWLIQGYRNKKKQNRKEDDELEAQVNDNTNRVSTLWSWAFGVPDDETDGGLSAEIQNGFDRIEEDIESVEKKQETYHEVEMAHLERLVNHLHDEESLDIDRDDILKDED